MSNLFFSYYKSPYILTYKHLLYLGYKLSNCKLVVNILLNQNFQTFKTNLVAELTKNYYINLFINESINIIKNK